MVARRATPFWSQLGDRVDAAGSGGRHPPVGRLEHGARAVGEDPRYCAMLMKESRMYGGQFWAGLMCAVAEIYRHDFARELPHERSSDSNTVSYLYKIPNTG